MNVLLSILIVLGIILFLVVVLALGFFALALLVFLLKGTSPRRYVMVEGKKEEEETKPEEDSERSEEEGFENTAVTDLEDEGVGGEDE